MDYGWKKCQNLEEEIFNDLENKYNNRIEKFRELETIQLLMKMIQLHAKNSLLFNLSVSELFRNCYELKFSVVNDNLIKLPYIVGSEIIMDN